MDEWREATLGGLGQIVGGGTPSRDRPDYWDGTIPWLTPGELTGHPGMTVCETADRITELGLASSGARVVPPNTVLVTSRATLGSCALAGCEMTTNQGFKNLVPSAGSDPRFLYFLMETLGAELTRRASGTTFLEVSGKEFARVAVKMPPLEEQRRIAEILDTIDETIRTAERVIAKLGVLHDGLRRELVPEHLCEGVVEARLGDLIDPSRPIVYGILMPGDHVNGGVPVVKVKDIRGGAIADRRNLLHTSRQIDEQYARSRVREGDLLFTIRGTVGRMAFVPAALDGANITQDTARLAIDGVNRSFLLAAMTAGPFSRFVDVHTIGQAVKGINLRELRQAPVLLLPRDQQEVVGATLDDSLALIDAERRRLDKLRLLRSGLGADLLSGRVRTVTA